LANVWPVQYTLYVDPVVYKFYRWPRKFFLNNGSTPADKSASAEQKEVAGARNLPEMKQSSFAQ
jgi:hypothetical protein